MGAQGGGKALKPAHEVGSSLANFPSAGRAQQAGQGRDSPGPAYNVASSCSQKPAGSGHLAARGCGSASTCLKTRGGQLALTGGLFRKTLVLAPLLQHLLRLHECLHYLVLQAYFEYPMLNV